MDRERGLLPATVEVAERVLSRKRDAESLRVQINAIEAAQDALQEMQRNLLTSFLAFVEIDHRRTDNRVRTHSAHAHYLRNTLDRRLVQRGLGCIKANLVLYTWDLAERKEAPASLSSGSSLRMSNDDHDADADQIQRVLFACPAPDCRGFVRGPARGTNRPVACGLCGIQACRSCREIVNTNVNGERPLPLPTLPFKKPHVTANNNNNNNDLDPASVLPRHVCDPAILASVREILQDSKECPACHSRISRTSGCNQMFCTVCHTPFDWVSLQIIRGAIHNPHYFEWRNSQGGGEFRPRPEDGDGACGARGPLMLLMGRTLHLMAKLVESGTYRAAPASLVEARQREIATVANLEQFIAHARDTIEPDYAVFAAPDRNLRLRVQYLIGELGDDEWQSKLHHDERVHERRNEFLLVWQAFGLAAQEILYSAALLVQGIVTNNGHQGEVLAPLSWSALATNECVNIWGSSLYLLRVDTSTSHYLNAVQLAHLTHIVEKATRSVWRLVDYTNDMLHRVARRFHVVYPHITLKYTSNANHNNRYLLYHTTSRPYTLAPVVQPA